MIVSEPFRHDMLRAERLTLAVLLSGVASLALSDFVSPVYWLITVVIASLRWWRGPGFALSELQASMIGWLGFLWVGLELTMGRPWAVAFTDFMLILALAVAVEAATPRNHLHRLLTATFLVLAAAVLTDSFFLIIPLICWLWLMWRASVCLYSQGMHEYIEAPPLRHDLRLMLLLVAGTGLLFVLMPRFDHHSALTGVQPRMKTGGFSDQVEIGSFARKLDTRVAFRIEAVNMTPQRFRQLMMGRYWRGVTLSRYNGRSWQRLHVPVGQRWSIHQNVQLAAVQAGHDIHLVMYREASDHAYIFLPDGLASIRRMPFSGEINVQGDARFRQPPSRRLRLHMRLSQQRVGTLRLAPPVAEERSRRHIPPQLRQWLHQVLGEQAQPTLASLLRLQQRLKTWTYDLNAPIDDAHPIVSFLQLRRGHCELYATLLALAARELGFPARIVNGYYGGEWNERGQFLIVRQQQAHSWTEVWVKGHWVRLDATPPSRWQLSGVRFPQLDDIWESIRLSWYRYILEFQNDDRMNLYRQLVSWLKGMLPRLLLLLLAGAALWWGWLFWRQRHSAVRLHAQWRVVDRWLQQHQVQRQPWQPLRLLPAPAAIDAQRWQAWLQQWEAQRYDPAQRPWSRRELKQKLRELE